MKKISLVLILCTYCLMAWSQAPTAANVTFSVDMLHHNVEVRVGGQLFTSLLYNSDVEKPILYPLNSAEGIEVTRGFPLNPRPGERVDHPHQAGCWFNYGDVNGLDFWNNSYAIPGPDKSKYGSIKNVKILKAADGTEGLLIYTCQWVDWQGKVLLNEVTSLIFSGNKSMRRVVRTTKLEAVNGDVRFGDNKEGLFAMRVDRAFETPSTTPEVFTDASGKATSVPVLNNEGVNGVFRSSEGKEKDDVWGTRASWVSLSARKEGKQISICMFDHPSNPGYPAYWHARGYGLFSVNNIGHKAYDPNVKENELFIKQGGSVVFRHELMILSGKAMTDAEMNVEFRNLSKK